jgi:hypothetical protein
MFSMVLFFQVWPHKIRFVLTTPQLEPQIGKKGIELCNGITNAWASDVGRLLLQYSTVSNE